MPPAIEQQAVLLAVRDTHRPLSTLPARITAPVGPDTVVQVLANRDPAILAQWLVRIVGSLILIEPPGPLEVFLAELLVPALAP